jgi:PIN domain nuclease of toxin-antitoxin system
MNGRKYLLDTHIIIWAVDQTDKLSEAYRQLLEQEDQCVVSIASLWEIAIKKSLGKLEVRDDLADFLRRTGVAILPVELPHIEAVRTLPHHHRDPFDRMLIAQAIAENLSLLTVDRHFALYGVTIA